MNVLYVIILTKLVGYIWSYWVHTVFIMRAAYMHWDITDITVIASLILLNINVVIVYIIRIV